jgi:hypothetical protein
MTGCGRGCGGTRERTRSRSTAQVRRRSRRLAPGVIGISLLMVFGAFFAVILPGRVLASNASPDYCIKCPNGSGCEPNCSCPVGTVGISSSATAQVTNVTVKFELTNTPAFITLIWGNTTSYAFTALSAVYYGSTNTWYSQFIDFLEPSKQYYYKITATETCYNSGVSTGSWTTGYDYASTISGTITDANGANAPNTFTVYASCSVQGGPPYAWEAETATYILASGKSYYSISTVSACPVEPGIAFHVEALTDSLYSGKWYGHWNETITFWGP